MDQYPFWCFPVIQFNMKRTKYLLFLAFGFVLFGLGCKKQLIEKYNEKKGSIKNTTEIQAADNFKWATYNVVGVSFVGIPDDVRQATFKVITPDGTNLFQKYQKANETLNFNLEVPSQYDSLLISYGTYSKYFSTKTGVAELRLK